MEPAAERTSAGQPANGNGSSELAELRSLLVGQDLERINALAVRLNDPQVRAAETGKILPDAIKAAPGKNLREAFEPQFERLFRNSVIKHPREISDAIYPVMGPAIRSYVAAAIREFAESLNQIVEKGASWRAIRWRIEARVTGQPFSELLLARSLLYSVDQVFLIHRRSGLLLAHLAAEAAVVKDADMVSGMFSAIQDFVSDSFTEAGQELDTIEIGRYRLWIQYGSKALLVGAVSGTAPVELRAVFRNALDKIHEVLLVPLETFKQGDLSVFEPAHPYLQSCLLGRRSPERRRNFAGWSLGAAVLLLIGFLFWWHVRDQRRWAAYVDALRREPGIVVIRAEQDGPRGRIEGLKDPQAPDPARLLGSFQLDPSRVRYSWQAFLSLNTPFAAGREIQTEVDRLQRQIIRFDRGSSKLQLAEIAQIDGIAEGIVRILKARPGSRVAITGHTDEVGSAQDNMTLSQDRAGTVRDALATQGVPPAALDIVGAGDTRPLRTGGTDWDRAANRSVSLQIVFPAR